MFLVDLLIIILLLLVNAFFVAAEFALVKVRVSQIEQLVEEGHWAAKITQRVLNDLDAFISASQLGITIASLALGRVIEGSVEPWITSGLAAVGLGGHPELAHAGSIGVVPAVALGIVTFLHIGLGEQVPKCMAIRAAKTTALITSPPLLAFYYVFYPAIWALNAFTNLILRIFGMGRITAKESAHSEEELRLVVAQSVEGGALTTDERKMIENVLSLEEKTARRVMIPRPDIVYLSLDRPVEENLALARSAGHTRYPLCEDDLSGVIGMIHIKDLIRHDLSRDVRPDLRKLVRKIPFLPESIRLDELLRAFQRDRIHLAMLLDEFGSVVGMVTMENVLEELVGPIQDEFDRETPQILPLGDGAWEVEATCPLDVFGEQVGLEVPEEADSDTVGGLILEELGRLARVGDAVVIEGFRLEVIQADPTRIRRVRVEKLAEDSESGEGEHGHEPEGSRERKSVHD